MSKEIKTNKITGEVVIKNGDYSFKQFGIYPDIIQLIEDLQQENKQLKDNWNELKEWAKHERKVSVGMQNGYGIALCDCMINKIQELEKGDSNGINRCI